MNEKASRKLLWKIDEISALFVHVAFTTYAEDRLSITNIITEEIELLRGTSTFFVP